MARHFDSGDFARDWAHVFLLGKARPDRRFPSSNRRSIEAPVGWKLVAGYPVRILAPGHGDTRPLDNRPSWRVPPVWDTPSDVPDVSWGWQRRERG